jgi:hypothetical protein
MEVTKKRLMQTATKILTDYNCIFVYSYKNWSCRKFYKFLRIQRSSNDYYDRTTATRYGLEGPGIEYRRGRDFPHPSRKTLGPTQPPVQCVRVSCREKKRLGRGVNHPPTSSAEVKERVFSFTGQH